MQLEECLSEASGECRCRLGDASLCSCQLSCETAEEVVLCLLRCQDRYWRKYSECVCGQEDNVICLWACGLAVDLLSDVGDVLDRIGYTSVLCDALVCEVDLAFCINCYVLEESVTLDSIVDVRLGFLIEVDYLSVAAALEVEYSVVIPTVLIITDKKWLG